MAPRNILIITPDTQIVLTVKCEVPEANETIRLRATIGTYNCQWLCTLRNETPQLEISLQWSIDDGCQHLCPPPEGVRALRILSRIGQHLYFGDVNGVKKGSPMIANLDLASLLVEGRLFFDIILSTSISTYLISPPMKNITITGEDEDEDVVVGPTPKDILSSMMRDITTTNIAFTFGLNGSARNVALWVHQSVLSHQPYMASLISKLQDVEGSDTTSVSGIKSTHVSEYSFESYCSLVRFLYTGIIDLEVNLDDFSIGCPPNKPYSASCKKRPVAEGLFPSAEGTGCKKDVDDIKLRTDWPELFQVADCYEVKKLRKYCKNKIVKSITTENALEMLFRFAYKYKDLKHVLLQHVADNMDKVFAQAQGEDPFEEYKDHPERYALLIQVLKLKSMVMA